MKPVARNDYVLVESEADPSFADPSFYQLDVFEEVQTWVGRDANRFYISVFKEIEKCTTLTGFTFYLAFHVPDRLPEYNDKVVLVTLLDEDYKHRGYFNDIRCVIRCLGPRPVYKDGFPTNPLKATALLHYFYKLSRHFGIILRDIRKSRRFTVSRVRRKTLHVPLGVFSHFNPDLRPIAEREIDYAFLGSVGFIQLSRTKKWIHRLLSPPKIQARRAMLGALQRLPEQYKGKIYATGDMLESIKNRDEYVQTLSNTKISLCPRGTSYETFRFFESCKAGCIVICEPLPDVWFYEEHPGIVINDWSRLPEIIEHVLEDEALLTARSAETLAYWNKVVSERAIAIRVAQFVEASEPARLSRKRGSAA